MEISKFHFITQEKNNLSHIQIVENACKSGIKWIQLRIKNKTLKEIEKISINSLQICKKYNSKLIINDYWEIAKNINADGVHLGLEDSKIDFVRTKTSEKFIIGGTANTFEDIVNQHKRSANYIGLGALRNTSTKTITKPLIGIDGYKNFITKTNEIGINIPIIAIGGINLDDLPKLKESGVFGIAVSNLIIESYFDKNTLSFINKYFTF